LFFWLFFCFVVNRGFSLLSLIYFFWTLFFRNFLFRLHFLGRSLLVLRSLILDYWSFRSSLMILGHLPLVRLLCYFWCNWFFRTLMFRQHSVFNALVWHIAVLAYFIIRLWWF
jgi:hypothetical protein